MQAYNVTNVGMLSSTTRSSCPVLHFQWTPSYLISHAVNRPFSFVREIFLLTSRQVMQSCNKHTTCWLTDGANIDQKALTNITSPRNLKEEIIRWLSTKFLSWWLFYASAAKHLSKQMSVVNSLHCKLPMHSAPRKMIASCKSWRGPNTVRPRDLHSWTGRVPKGGWAYSPMDDGISPRPLRSYSGSWTLPPAPSLVHGNSTAVLVTSSAMTFTGWIFANVSSTNCAWLCINVCTA